MRRCRGCGAGRIATLIDLGLQPLSNRFLRSRDEDEERYPMALGQCDACGLVQLSSEMVPTDAMRPRFDWITYAEPEGHLDEVASSLAALPGLGDGPVVRGVTFKDDTLLRRLRERRGARTDRLDPAHDLGIADPRAGLETIQERLDPVAAARVARRRGGAHLVIARHVFEHVDDPLRALAALAALALPDAYLLVEVPDCTRALEHGDPTMFWEEHSLYLTSETFHGLLRASGFELIRSLRIPHPLDDLLIAVVRRGDRGSPSDDVAVERERERARRYARGFARVRATVPAALARAGERVAMFGAGHLGCVFVNLLGIAQHVEFFVDDFPHKRGLYMPGSKLAIRASSDLAEARIQLCLLSLSPDSEMAVVRRNERFGSAGGTFASIFPGARRASDGPVRSFEAAFGGGDR